MATKKNSSSQSQLEIKISKENQNSTKAQPQNNQLLPIQQKVYGNGTSLSSANSKMHESKSPDLLQHKFPANSDSSAKTGCCMGKTSCGSSEQLAKKNIATVSSSVKTRVVVRYDVGFNNFLSIRGKGANLNWEKGVTLKNVKSDEWVWETDASFNTCEFKVLMNDNSYEIGTNHPISCGACIQYTPKF